tara:strand:- start:341 stop:592 length:252 start_codon:yes stop_codon:yes gene_type:complete
MVIAKDTVTASTSFMEQAMEYAKNPQYVMMFLGFIFLLGIGYMMYTKPDMLQKLMNPNSVGNKAPPTHDMNEESNEEYRGEDL